jgi:Matrixin
VTRIRLVTVFAAAAVFLAAAAPPAAARHAGVRHYVQLGFNVWGEELAHCPSVQFSWRNAGPRTLGWVDSIGGCSFHLNARLSYYFHHVTGLACTVVIHEMGHLAGQQHTTDRSSIMYEGYERGHVSTVCVP